MFITFSPRLLILTIVYLFSSAFLFSQEIKKKDTSKVALKKYEDLIEKATLKKGMFNIIKLKNDYYFEIPDSLFNREFLIVNKISKVPLPLNEAGLNKGMVFDNKVITFQKDTLLNKVWVRTSNPMVTSPKNDAITQSVQNNFSSSIIEAFTIVSVNKKASSIVVGVNKVFDGEKKSFNNVFNDTGLGGSAETNLSYIEMIKTFPKNVLVRSALSTSVTEGAASVPITIETTCNIVLLSKTPMQPRFSDNHIGYFSKKRWFFNDKQHAMKEKNLITRWRLEPRKEDIDRYLKGQLVEPKKPITFYIDPSTPKKWRDYIKKGVVDWQKTFERAGFKNAIIAKDPADNDVDFDIDDVRYSVITYAASPRANAMGPSVVDPRSGEILESDIIWWHNLMTSLHSWMRIQTGPIDTKARKNVFEDEHMGEAIRFVSSHEVGHTLGLKHNMGASFAYKVDSLRSKTFTKNHGTAPSIMDYARYNYVAQPEDSVTTITPKIGVYDTYAIEWGYRWFANNHIEETYLKNLIKKHSNDPEYFYGEQQSHKNIIDPRSQTEDIGDDAVLASEYGIKNLKTVVSNLINWTYEEGEDYYTTGRLYMGVIGQWSLYNNHVLNNVGGVYLNNTVHGDNKKSYKWVPYKKQKEAVNYLNKHVFTIPHWLFLNNTINYTYPLKKTPLGPYEYSPYTLAREMQYSVFYNLFKDERLLRLIESELDQEKNLKTFTAKELLESVRNHVFKNTKNNKSLTLLERMTQKNYVDVLAVDLDKLSKKNNKKAVHVSESLQLPIMCNYTSAKKMVEARNINYTLLKRVSEVGSLKRGELNKILKLLRKKRNKGNDDTKMHYLDLIERITNIINP
ncbi:zinc-dependent metalloprotease [Tenacibaculum sp. IB213877]|uniref:zinc-dependent metalloprotease n=1 Tax=Tenacibaculum sp. IB213877 TaxID=3097351 RepID=UPI002A5A9433|nr:zinc-dependent metalloprotease [Tenacibaculum sp. IB213877]MDY0781234.1 zinc-dependent metalloprotease [Tenacibaculum sp. IB213877]